MRLGVGLAITNILRGGGSAPAWTPASLFASGEKGFFYDFSDVSVGNMYQDVGKTTPAVAATDPVAWVRDKSGNENHAIRRTDDTCRPLLTAVGDYYCIQFDGVTNATGDQLVAIDGLPAGNVTQTDFTVGVAYQRNTGIGAVWNGMVLSTGASVYLSTHETGSSSTALSSAGISTDSYAINGAPVSITTRGDFDIALGGLAEKGVLRIQGQSTSALALKEIGVYSGYAGFKGWHRLSAYVAINRDLTPAEAILLDNWLAWRMGIGPF